MPWRRDRQGTPGPLSWHRLSVAGPFPPLKCWMSSDGPVHLLPGPVDIIGDLVAEVLVGLLQGPVGHEVPEDLVGIGPSHRTCLSKHQ